MPKAKPMGLNPAKRRKSERAARVEAELSLAPVQALPDMPAELTKGHAYAAAIWKRLMQLYAETIAEVVTAFDRDLMISYCLTLEEAVQLNELRSSAFEIWRGLTQRLKALERAKKLEEVIFLSELVTSSFDKITKVDARLDGKRKLAHQLAQSLYLTPRARAGAAPPRKPAQPEADEMDTLLNEAREAAGV